MKRFGQVIRVKPEHFEEYKKLHAAVWPEVLEQIAKSNIKNYTIFHRKGLMFAMFEYHGTDFEGDMKRMGEDPNTQRWWSVVGPMQDPLPDRAEGEWWANMEEVFHCD